MAVEPAWPVFDKSMFLGRHKSFAQSSRASIEIYIRDTLQILNLELSAVSIIIIFTSIHRREGGNLLHSCQQEAFVYIPDHFAETRPEEIRRIINDHPLGTLVTSGPDGLDANQIPFALVEHDSRPVLLRAHVALANPLWQEISADSQVLVVFRGQESYLSPNWYPSKRESHRMVPTWNYQVVNVRGRIRFIDDPKLLLALVGHLTRDHESRLAADKPWRIGEAPRDYIETMLQNIVGIEINIDRIDAKSKLSQNREERDRLSAADVFDRRGQQELAEAIRRPRRGD
jgi:transcriptional regulator